MSFSLTNSQIGDYTTINSVEGTQINNHTHHHPPPEREDRVKLSGRTFRHVIEGDINILRNLSSQVINVRANPQSYMSQVVQLQRMDDTAEVFGAPGQVFTVTTFRPVNGSDANEFEKIKEHVCQMVSLYRESPFVTKLFGMGESDGLRLLTYNDLANGHDILHQHQGRHLTYHYLLFTKEASFHALSRDNNHSLGILIVRDQHMWKYNLNNFRWQYDLSSSISIPGQRHRPYDCISSRPLPVPERPIQLIDSQIIGHLEEIYGDFIHYMGQLEPDNPDVNNELSRLARDGYLTLGAAVDPDKSRILSHFRPTTPPSTNYENFSNGFNVIHWGSDGQCDFSFERTGKVFVDIEFMLQFHYQQQLRAAYLSQYLRYHSNYDPHQLSFVTQLAFRLTGEFFHDSMAHPTLAYLFVPPIQAVKVNNMYCVPYPLPKTLFFWTSDPEGKHRIEESDWEQYNIPKLQVSLSLESSYNDFVYTFARNYMCSKGYEPDGRRYCRDHNLPELIPGDPHDMDLFGVQIPDMSFRDISNRNQTALRLFRVGTIPNQVVIVDMETRYEDWSVCSTSHGPNSWHHTEVIKLVDEDISIMRFFMVGSVSMVCQARAAAGVQSFSQLKCPFPKIPSVWGHRHKTSNSAGDLRHYMTLRVSEVKGESSRGVDIEYSPGTKRSMLDS
ncbi:hypothetical protein PQX77_012764 [Marasmius sp. AFHP31]|nr:hypothetical protein PQX77_012764 [Marasmius sp. AFHP31]